MLSRSFVRPLMMGILALALAAPPLASAQTATKEYGKSGDWTLRRTTVGGDAVLSCDMFHFSGSEEGLRFYYGEGRGELGFSGLYSANNAAPMQVQMWFDDDRANAQLVSMTLEKDGNGYEWRTYGASNDEPDAVLDDLVLNSAKISFAYFVPDVGNHVQVFSLKGYAEASVKTTECVNGPNDRSAEAAPAAVAAAAPMVIKGTCKLVVDGKTYVDVKKTCPIWMANDGTGAFWINSDRETYLGDYFAEIVPDGKGAASGHWNGEKGATHAQSFLGEDFKQGKGGCWRNARAAICAQK